MRKQSFIILVVALSLFGAYLLGRGITGFFAIEGSCCFPPDCPTDYLCAAARPVVESPSVVAGTTSYGGLFLLLGSVVLLAALTAAYVFRHHSEKS